MWCVSKINCTRNPKHFVVIAPRSYLVKNNTGQIYRRNRHQLIRTNENPDPDRLDCDDPLDNRDIIAPTTDHSVLGTPQNFTSNNDGVCGKVLTVGLV